jgi:hypothetical protein
MMILEYTDVPVAALAANINLIHSNARTHAGSPKGDQQ